MINRKVGLKQVYSATGKMNTQNMSGMLIVYKPIKFQDFTCQNRKLTNRLKILVWLKGNQQKRLNFAQNDVKIITIGSETSADC